MKISVVTPAYKCAESLKELHRRLVLTLDKITPDYEIIMVNDASPENDWAVIREICALNKRVKGINFSRNFGQHFAISAGLDYTQGEWVVVMDADLQDQPEEIAKLYDKALEGYEIVYARREIRNDNFIKRTGSKCFYAALSYLTGTKQDSSIANFGIYSHQVVKVISTLKESFRYFPVMVRWSGFKSTAVAVEHSSREFGSTSYNFSRLFDLAINVILSFSDKPLKIIIKTGFLISLFSALLTVVIIVLALTGKTEVLGWASTISSIWLLSGLIMLTLGVTGLYIGKIFEQVKNRPLYIVRETLND